MNEWGSILGSAILSAFVGGIIGAFVDRIFTVMLSWPRLRVSIAPMQWMDRGSMTDDVPSVGFQLQIENVGFAEIQQYKVSLFHPKRGWLGIFHGRRENVFPQHPFQTNEFDCITAGTGNSSQHSLQWLRQSMDGEVVVPEFSDFSLRIVLANSEVVLFDDKKLGTNIARYLFEAGSRSRTSQFVDDVRYVSHAPFWIEWLRKYRGWMMRRRMRQVIEGKRKWTG